MGKKLKTAIILALGLVTLQRAGCRAPLSINHVAGASCEPNIKDGGDIVTSSLPLWFDAINRGDFVTANIGGTSYVKRVEGIPGDEIVDCPFGLYINGNLEKKYEKLAPENISDWIEHHYRRKFNLGENEYFLVGPNYLHSLDSRDFGPVKKDQLIGKVIFDF